MTSPMTNLTTREAELLIHAVKTQKLREIDLSLDDRLIKVFRNQHKENIKVYETLIEKLGEEKA